MEWSDFGQRLVSSLADLGLGWLGREVTPEQVFRPITYSVPPSPAPATTIAGIGTTTLFLVGGAGLLALLLLRR